MSSMTTAILGRGVGPLTVRAQLKFHSVQNVKKRSRYILVEVPHGVRDGGLAIPMIPARAPHPVVRIRPTRGLASLGIHELWQYRELLYFLIWRDVKVRYAQTALGISWAVIQPFLTMVVFSVFFGRLVGVPSDGVPYPIFTFAALVPWTFFANGLVQSANSLVVNPNLIKKAYFPRLAIPITAVLSGVVDLVVAFAMLLGMMVFYGISPSSNIVWLPALLVLALASSLGMGLWLSALNVLYRDVRVLTPFLVQLWLLATPVAYPSGLLREPWRTLNGINPMAGVVEGVRWAMLGTPTAPGPAILVSAAASLVLLIGGAFYFRRMEWTFADRV
jgi:lipopolysaccharide transport system permease protein